MDVGQQTVAKGGVVIVVIMLHSRRLRCARQIYTDNTGEKKL